MLVLAALEVDFQIVGGVISDVEPSAPTDDARKVVQGMSFHQEHVRNVKRRNLNVEALVGVRGNVHRRRPRGVAYVHAQHLRAASYPREGCHLAWQDLGDGDGVLLTNEEQHVGIIDEQILRIEGESARQVVMSGIDKDGDQDIILLTFHRLIRTFVQLQRRLLHALDLNSSGPHGIAYEATAQLAMPHCVKVEVGRRLRWENGRDRIGKLVFIVVIAGKRAACIALRNGSRATGQHGWEVVLDGEDTNIVNDDGGSEVQGHHPHVFQRLIFLGGRSAQQPPLFLR